jgi:hypothetical protein
MIVIKYFLLTFQTFKAFKIFFFAKFAISDIFLIYFTSLIVLFLNGLKVNYIDKILF